MAKGGSLENAVVVKDNEILNDEGLRNRHEFVYHKILDCLGDLMLSGHRIIGHIKSSQGGHALTNKLLVKFFSDSSNWSMESLSAVEKNNQIEEKTKKPLFSKRLLKQNFTYFNLFDMYKKCILN